MGENKHKNNGDKSSGDGDKAASSRAKHDRSDRSSVAGQALSIVSAVLQPVVTDTLSVAGNPILSTAIISPPDTGGPTGNVIPPTSRAIATTPSAPATASGTPAVPLVPVTTSGNSAAAAAAVLPPAGTPDAVNSPNTPANTPTVSTPNRPSFNPAMLSESAVGSPVTVIASVGDGMPITGPGDPKSALTPSSSDNHWLVAGISTGAAILIIAALIILYFKRRRRATRIDIEKDVKIERSVSPQAPVQKVVDPSGAAGNCWNTSSTASDSLYERQILDFTRPGLPDSMIPKTGAVAPRCRESGFKILSTSRHSFSMGGVFGRRATREFPIRPESSASNASSQLSVTVLAMIGNECSRGSVGSEFTQGALSPALARKATLEVDACTRTYG